MTSFESDEFQWRETYFVLFESSRRPTLASVEHTLRDLSDRFELRDIEADDEGLFESATLLAPDDYAALDISYLEGEDVLAQGAALFDEMKPSVAGNAPERAKLARLTRCNARLDVMHFEQMVESEDGEEEMLDPSALLIVLEALAKLTGGIGVDPQSGSLM